MNVVLLFLQTYRTYRYDLRKRDESESEPGYKRRIISKYEVSITQDGVHNYCHQRLMLLVESLSRVQIKSFFCNQLLIHNLKQINIKYILNYPIELKISISNIMLEMCMDNTLKTIPK